MQIYYTDITVDDGKGGILKYAFGFYKTGETPPTDQPLATGSTMTNMSDGKTKYWDAETKTWI